MCRVPRRSARRGIATLAVVWDTVFVVLVGVLYAVVFVIAVLSLIVLPALVISSWVGRRRGRRGG